jgi:hypothetical protein
MQEVTERDWRENRARNGTATKLAVILGALGFVVVLAAVLQVFARYQYLVDNGVVWRIDRLTHQACPIRYGRLACTPPSRSTSTSTSLSTSVSPKVFVRRPQRYRKKT